MTQKERSKLIRKLDIEFSKLVRQRDGECLWCGSMQNLQCSHLINRSELHYRWDFDNCMTLCYACHIHKWHKKPLDAAEWLAKSYPQYYDYWMANRHVVHNQKVDLTTVRERILSEFKAYGNN